MFVPPKISIAFFNDTFFIAFSPFLKLMFFFCYTINIAYQIKIANQKTTFLLKNHYFIFSINVLIKTYFYYKKSGE
jgi:hypothetical protein